MADLVLKQVDDAFGHWLAGFAAADGSFGIGKNGRGARFTFFRIALHHEDLPVLEEIQQKTGLGKVWVGHSPSQKSPAAMWSVLSKADCVALVELFERYPLRAKKQRDFDIWARAVRARVDHRYGDWNVVDALRNELCAGRPQRGRKAWVV